MGRKPWPTSQTLFRAASEKKKESRNASNSKTIRSTLGAGVVDGRGIHGIFLENVEEKLELVTWLLDTDLQDRFHSSFKIKIDVRVRSRLTPC